MGFSHGSSPRPLTRHWTTCSKNLSLRQPASSLAIVPSTRAKSTLHRLKPYKPACSNTLTHWNHRSSMWLWTTRQMGSCRFPRNWLSSSRNSHNSSTRSRGTTLRSAQLQKWYRPAISRSVANRSHWITYKKRGLKLWRRSDYKSSMTSVCKRYRISVIVGFSSWKTW